jgi:gamma-glutamyltranspeptidase/glutathione hydrolase
LSACTGGEPPATRIQSEIFTSRTAPRAAVEGQRFMVVAANPHAAEAGRAMLRAGGSAVDAAIAAQMVLNVVEPQASGIGGGGFLLHYAGGTGEIAAYDGREVAPSAANSDLFLGADGQPLTFEAAARSGLSVGVPGVLRMLERVHRDHGRLPWARLFEPAIEIAEKGFTISPRLHASLKADTSLRSMPAGSYFYEPSGQPKAVGSLLRNLALAETFRMIARDGTEAF